MPQSDCKHVSHTCVSHSVTLQYQTVSHVHHTVSQSQLKTLQHLCIPESSSQGLHQWAPYICEGRFSEKKDFSTNTWKVDTRYSKALTSCSIDVSTDLAKAHTEDCKGDEDTPYHDPLVQIFRPVTTLGSKSWQGEQWRFVHNAGVGRQIKSAKSQNIPCCQRMSESQSTRNNPPISSFSSQNNAIWLFFVGFFLKLTLEWQPWVREFWTDG